MKLYSWNVNGVRAVAKKGFLDWLGHTAPDVLCLQETKAHPEQLEGVLREPPGYHAYWHSAEKKGYSGVVTLCREEPIAVEVGLGIEEFDREGRVLMTEFPNFQLYNMYFPNSQREHGRLPYKVAFCEAVLRHCDARRADGKRLVICGDYNIAHRAMDLARPKANENNAGFLPEERAWMDAFVGSGYVDTFRALYPGATGRYTWWSYQHNARENNVGWRIDYHCVTDNMMSSVTDARILPDVMGSDHCPIVLELTSN